MDKKLRVLGQRLETISDKIDFEVEKASKKYGVSAASTKNPSKDPQVSPQTTPAHRNVVKPSGYGLSSSSVSTSNPSSYSNASSARLVIDVKRLLRMVQKLIQIRVHCCDGLTAPWVIDKAMNRAAFDTYIETQLAPTLEKGDVVILDNLAVRKSVKATEILKEKGAWFLFLPPYSLPT